MTDHIQQIPEMAGIKAVLITVMMTCMTCVSGLSISKPENLALTMMDGEVMAVWDDPLDRPLDAKYNVQMAKYGGEWAPVKGCTGITKNFCDLSSLIHDYSSSYKVRVQRVSEDGETIWTRKKFSPNESGLSPPSFTLWATSSTLKIYIHQKPILKKLYPYGVIYTILLEETGEENKTTTAYLKDDVEEEERGTTFTSLYWGREYCVSIKVEGSGALLSSAMSHKQCLHLPEQEWFIIAVSSLSVMGALVLFVIMGALLYCYLIRSEKTPAVLKSPISGWLPLSAAEGKMEVVTDKGWFLSNYRTEIKSCVKIPVTLPALTEDSGEEDRRTSTDSGVSMESSSTTNSGGSPPSRQEDSGCGSLGGSESTSSSQTENSLKDEKTNTDAVSKREDSGFGPGCQFDSSLNLEGQDNGLLKEVVSGGDYRSQCHSSVQIQVCDNKEDFKLPDLAEVVTGYRAVPQSCICSGAGQCTWCHQQRLYGTEVIKQYRAVCGEDGLLSRNSSSMGSYNEKITFSSYPENTQMDTVIVDDLESTFIQLKETFPLLTALTPLPVEERKQDFNMNNVCLSLSDLQLITD